MTTRTIKTWRTQSAADAIELREHVSGARTSYSYIGKHGAGCGHDLQELERHILANLARRRGITLEAPHG